MSELNHVEIVKLYKEGKSCYELAEHFSTYANKIRRVLKKFVKLRDKSEAQKMAISSGRAEHPTEGKEMSKDTKNKISIGLSKFWKGISKKELQRRSKVAKDNWDKLSNTQKTNLQNAAHEAIRLAAKEGSKLEKAILSALEAKGWKVKFHQKDLVANEKLEADIYLPDISTIIEIDGPSHYLPIWGDDKLQQVIRADADKNGLAIMKGFVMIRIKCVVENVAEHHKNKAVDQLIPIVEKLYTKLPPKTKRLIELEIS